MGWRIFVHGVREVFLGRRRHVIFSLCGSEGNQSRDRSAAIDLHQSQSWRGQQIVWCGCDACMSDAPLPRPADSAKWLVVCTETVPVTELLPRLGSRQRLGYAEGRRTLAGQRSMKPRRLARLWRRLSQGADVAKPNNGLRSGRRRHPNARPPHGSRRARLRSMLHRRRSGARLIEQR
jgi:hypothetical protein